MTLAKVILIWLVAIPVACLCLTSLLDWYYRSKYGEWDE